MILFYNKSTGKVIGVIDGRVHDERQLRAYVDDGAGKDNIGKYIIGWIENKTRKVEYNLDKLNILQRFEDTSSFSPLDCKIVNGEIII